MTEPSLSAIERFHLLNSNVKIEPTTLSSNNKTTWTVFGQSARKNMQGRAGGWLRIAVRDTENEVRTFCAEWGLSIVEQKDEDESKRNL